MDNIENTMIEILKVDPNVAIGISKLIMSAYILTVGTTNNVISAEATEFEYQEVKNAIRSIEDSCIAYVINKGVN